MRFKHWAAASLSVAMMTMAHADIGKKDQDFLKQAAAGGMFEVEAGKAAQQKGKSEGVKSFGAMLEKDHSAANEELKGLAQRKGVSLPTELPADKKSQLEKINQANDFDKQFIEIVGVDAHKKDIELFEKASQGAEDADVKAFATKTLPVLKSHREHAEELKKTAQ